MSTQLSDLDRCLIHRAVEDLVIEAQNALDDRDFGRFAALFVDNGRLYRPTTPDPVVGPEAIRDSYGKNPPNRFNRHLITNFRIDIHSSVEVKARAYVTLMSTEAGDQVADVFGAPVHRCLVGEFHDHCVRTRNGWRFQERRAEFTLNMPIARTDS